MINALGIFLTTILGGLPIILFWLYYFRRRRPQRIHAAVMIFATVLSGLLAASFYRGEFDSGLFASVLVFGAPLWIYVGAIMFRAPRRDEHESS